MKPQLSPRLLSYIARQIREGRPVNAMLWANEYLDSNSPLHHALQIKSRQKTICSKSKPEERRAIGQVLSGTKSCELKQNRSRRFLYEPSPKRRSNIFVGRSLSFSERIGALRQIRHVRPGKPALRDRVTRWLSLPAHP